MAGYQQDYDYKQDLRDFLSDSRAEKRIVRIPSEKDKISEKDLLRKLQYSTVKGEYRANIDRYIKGNVFLTKVKEAFFAAGVDFTPYESFDPVYQDYDRHPYFMLWHTLYSIDEIKDVRSTLTGPRFGFSKELADSLRSCFRLRL